jgi:hypothetical protein
MRFVIVQSARHRCGQAGTAYFFGKTAAADSTSNPAPEVAGQTMKISGHQWHLLSQRGAM